jgi:hypothetical protein
VVRGPGRPCPNPVGGMLPGRRGDGDDGCRRRATTARRQERGVDGARRRRR